MVGSVLMAALAAMALAAGFAIILFPALYIPRDARRHAIRISVGWRVASIALHYVALWQWVQRRNAILQVRSEGQTADCPHPHPATGRARP